ncbi:unnamed protein product [Prorocentrum cordatum]|uniref:Uncharacterized protein n=1 Tax=Prorocentrum cordatum TaxID=2364126 RepID=A0ABN9U7N1_9DINO|nr:unnamed protein product [Polarella glacialis]
MMVGATSRATRCCSGATAPPWPAVSLDGGSMVFVTIGGVERCRIRAAPTARLADTYLQLVAEHRAGRLGPGAWRVEAILPGGRPLSSAAAEETVASAFPAAA